MNDLPPIPDPSNPAARLRQLHDALAELLRSDALARGDLPASLILATQTAARIIDVRRVSVWKLAAGHESLECVDLFDAELRTHERGQRLWAKDTPHYFQALGTARVIAADDAQRDPRTAEFTDGYLRPLGITSMLDAPVLLRGELHGVLCLEHVGPARAWEPWQLLVAGNLADFVGTAFGAEEHVTQRRELTAYRDHLEQRVNERTAELRRAEQSLRDVFALTPVAMVVSSLDDQTLIDGNRRAEAMFEISVEEARGKLAPSFWVHPEDRDRLRGVVKESGRAEGFEAELKSRSGRVFWAELSAGVLSYDGRPALLITGSDITVRRRAEASLRESETMLRTLLGAAPVPLVVAGLKDDLLRYANQSAADLLQLPLDQLAGRPAPDFFHLATDRRAFREALARGGVVDGFTARIKNASQPECWMLISARTLELGGEAVYVTGFADLTEQKALEDKLRQLATIDGLTGAINRRHLFEVGELELKRAARHAHPTALAMLDVDHSKAINDDLGHAFGDTALRSLVDTVREQVRGTDVIARYGGEEFVVLLPQTALEAALQSLERVRVAIGDRPVVAQDTSRRMTVSIGLTIARPGESLAAGLRRADEALYEAKESGRDRLVVRG